MYDLIWWDLSVYCFWLVVFIDLNVRYKFVFEFLLVMNLGYLLLGGLRNYLFLLLCWMFDISCVL